MTAKEIIQKAKELDKTCDCPIYCQYWGEVVIGRYAGRGNPNGMRIKTEEDTFTEEDWKEAELRVARYLRNH